MTLYSKEDYREAECLRMILRHFYSGSWEEEDLRRELESNSLIEVAIKHNLQVLQGDTVNTEFLNNLTDLDCIVFTTDTGWLAFMKAYFIKENYEYNNSNTSR